MGDRNNPIKFGPEWLRNLSRERNLRTSSSTQNPASSASMSVGAVTTSSVITTSANTSSSTASFNSKVQLAKLRYGREEMLALYDRTSEAPQELKYIELLYQPRGKPPVALNTTFDEDMRENIRTAPPAGSILPGDRFGAGRGGVGRGSNVIESRGRPRIPFVRQTTASRSTSWHLGNPRMPGYSGGADDDSAAAARPWNNNGNMSAARNTGDVNEWPPNKVFRSKRPGTNTNWRQSNREDDEWRLSDTMRPRSTQQDKWDRDWSDRPQEKPQTWSANRRTWVGGDSQNNEDNLPEWAVDGTEACAGTFDSSGAFHGSYSHDDTNLPKTQDSSFPLTRSHTHGSFIRSKTAEEGSEEWWASEKAKKLSPKRFDASEIKFKKSLSHPAESSSSSNVKSYSKDELHQDKPESPVNNSTPLSESCDSNNDDTDKRHIRFGESKTFDSLVRPDINIDEASDERGNFQSVMITPNNSLRQKHQKIVSSSTGHDNNQSRNMQSMQNKSTNQMDSILPKQIQTPEEKIVNEIVDMTLEDKDVIADIPLPSDKPLVNSCSTAMSSGISSTLVNAMSQMSNPAMQLRISPVLPNQGLGLSMQSNLSTPVLHNSAMQTASIQPAGMPNSALNVSLGLAHNNSISQPINIPLQNVPPHPVLQNQAITNTSINASGMSGNTAGIQSYQSGSAMPGMAPSNIVNSSLFMGQNSSNAPLQGSNEMQLPNHHGNQTNMFPLHGLQRSPTPGAFGSSIYSNIMQQNNSSSSTNNQNLAEQWYYEDPKKNIQGPFSSKEMYNWYRAGFFSPSLMVRRACDTMMRPLGSYGPVVPFSQMDVMFPISGGFESRNQAPHESLITSQQGLGLDVMSTPNLSDNSSLQFGTVGLMRNPPYNQQQTVDTFWSQPSPPELIWMQQAMNPQRNEARVNNLPMFFWDQQPTAVTSNSLLPEEIAKEMKTEDQILAQLRAPQNINSTQNLNFLNDPPPAPLPPPDKREDTFTSIVNVTPNLEELQKFISEDTLKDTPGSNNKVEELQTNREITSQLTPATNEEPVITETNPVIIEAKVNKQNKNEAEKITKMKEASATKVKSKKAKEEKKDEITDNKVKEEIKRESESSPSKTKKEEKLNKKEIEKERKEWIKDGYTIVKGVEKNSNNNKKKADETKPVEDAEKKRKEEKLAADEEKKKKQAEINTKKKQEIQQQQRQAQESVMKKAPWCSAGGAASQAPSKEGLTLAEIQRLEREKKLEQMKEQQQMMALIAQQQAAALAREQEMQAGLGWAKKKNSNVSGQSFAEIQEETRKQQSSSTLEALASPPQVEEAPSKAPAQHNNMPWGNPPNGGFWDTQAKAQAAAKKLEQSKNKKKAAATVSSKKDNAPTIEFENWCTTVLASWSAKIDVPTFVGFLRDIESPYEVKDYVKCYLGESKDSGDFARQFLERRSKLLRVGMVTPSDDLCSPAIAINPRTTSNSDYQEVKGKGKKTKKNKMLKVDARILGFSVTASEDRINVGDIDTV